MIDHQRVRAEISEVLWNVWDPIGLNKRADWPKDEYDGYVNAVYHLLISGSADVHIANHLLLIVQENMEIPAKFDDMIPTVKALRQIKLS